MRIQISLVQTIERLQFKLKTSVILNLQYLSVPSTRAHFLVCKCKQLKALFSLAYNKDKKVLIPSCLTQLIKIYHQVYHKPDNFKNQHPIAKTF